MTFNIADYLLHARLREGLGDKTAIIGSRSVTYRQLSDEVARVAAGLRSFGLRCDDRIVLVMDDDVEMAVTILAAFHAGLVAVPVSTMLVPAELAVVMADSGATAVVTTVNHEPTVTAAVASSPDVEHLIVSGAAEPAVRGGIGVHHWDRLVSASPMDPAPTGDDTWALWLYTSGTTGRPKAAIHRHANIRWVHQTYGLEVLGISAADRCLSVAKMFFAYGIGNSLFFPLAAGATSILEPARPTAASIGARIADAAPTLFFGVPTFYATLLDSELAAEVFATVRLGVSAGEVLPGALRDKMKHRFGVDVIDGIGSTEALHIFLSNRPGEIRNGTTGRAVPGYELEIRDANGAVAAQGVPGSLYVKGESIALGYWRRADASRAVFEGRWLATGDTFVEDEDGYYRCLGRSNDLLKAGGIWVSPAEVEARLLAHPAVAEVAVVGVADSEGLEKPVAAVVRRHNHNDVDADCLIAWCREGLAAFKRPREVIFVDGLPKTATGKLQRFKVRELVLATRKSEVLQ
jgi:benzoate-CoA ligase family protein